MTFDSDGIKRRHSDAVLAVLKEFGPLNFEAIKFFVFKRFALNLAVTDVSLSISGNLKDVCAIDPDYSIVFIVGDEREPLFPVVRNYVAAFFDLLEKFEFVKAHSDFKGLPASWVDEVFELQHKPDVVEEL